MNSLGPNEALGCGVRGWLTMLWSIKYLSSSSISSGSSNSLGTEGRGVKRGARYVRNYRRSPDGNQCFLSLIKLCCSH